MNQWLREDIGRDGSFGPFQGALTEKTDYMQARLDEGRYWSCLPEYAYLSAETEAHKGSP